jgi:putative MFS transporter
MFSGLFVGTALVSFVADRFGRRTIFTYSLLWYTVASVIMAFQHDAFGLNLWRFISGIGVGVELVTIDTYLSELVPPTCAAARSPSIKPSNFAPCPWSRCWRGCWFRALRSGWMAGAGWCCSAQAGAILVWWIRRRVPESPRWLAQQRDAPRLAASLKCGGRPTARAASC